MKVGESSFEEGGEVNDYLSLNRHPELVSGSTPPLARSYRRQTKSNGQIDPLRVFGANEVYFPRPMPVFQLLLALNRALHITKHFKMDKPIDRIFRGMSGHYIIAVLVKTLEQVRSHADVERPMRLARKNVNARVFFRLHQRIVTAKWTLKQVQGDGFFVSCASPHPQRPKPCHPELVSGSIGRFAPANMRTRVSPNEFLGAAK